MKDFIPHQLGLTQRQINNLHLGRPVNILHRTMGSGAGDTVIMLHPQNARKLLTAYKKGKGMRLIMHPHELETSVLHGRGFFSSLKKGAKHIGRAVLDKGKEFLHSPAAKELGKNIVKRGSEAIGTAIGAYTGNPAIGSMIGHSLDRAGEAAIDKGGVHHGIKSLKGDAKAVALEALDEKIQQLPPAYRKSAEMALAGEYPGAVSNIVQHEYENATGGYGLKKGSAAMKEKMARLRAMKGGKINIGKKIGHAFKNIGKPIASALIHGGIPAAASLVGDVLGGPMGGIAGATAGNYAANRIGRATGYGIPRGRGRPRKEGGDVASMSAPYKRALRLNYGGLQLNNVSSSNPPVSDFDTNPRVAVSPTDMTLSPYQRMNSPAMNPFIPTKYTQQGGTSCGYGGRGLYGGGIY